MGATVEWPEQIPDKEMRGWKESPFCQVHALSNKVNLTVRVVMEGEWADYELRATASFPMSEDAWIWSDESHPDVEVVPTIEQRWVMINKGVAYEQPLVPAKLGGVSHLSDNSSMARELFHLIPGATTSVPHPCTCHEVPNNMLWQLVQHLNDTHHPNRVSDLVDGDPWTRERIADWLDTLDLDLSVDTAKAEDVKSRRRSAQHARAQQAMLTVTASMEQMQQGASIAAQKLEMLAKKMEPLSQSEIWKQLGLTEPEATKEES